MKKRILALVLCFMMALSACQQGAQEPPISADLPAVVEKTEPVEIPDAEGAVGVDKSETVHVKADADGTPKEITVETVLSKLGDVPSVADVSRLTNIRNTEGDEAFREDGDGDGALTWENHGVSITYEGKSDKEPPVSVHISYYLDGMETEPNALAGKSGRVTIRFDYENHTTQTITVSQADLDAVALKEDEKLDNLEDYETPTETIQQETVVPFLAVSAVMLNDHFSNVEVTNGEVMTVGNDQIVMGYALPNVADVLKLSDWEMTEKVELPDYVEFSADVVDFSLDFTATIVTNGIFEELDEEDLADFDDLAVATKLMQECSEALEATREDLEIKIANEKISKPKITPEFVTFWLHRFRKLDVENEAHRKMLVDTFVNAVYLYDDKIVVTFNYKDNSSSISLAAVTEAAGNGSDMVCSGAPTSGRKFRGFSFAFHRFGRILHLKGLYSQRAFSPLLQFLPQTGFFVLSGVDLFSMKLFKKL